MAFNDEVKDINTGVCKINKQLYMAFIFLCYTIHDIEHIITKKYSCTLSGII